MEIFSNSSTDYWKQIIKELTCDSNVESQNFQYLEVEQLLTYGFSVILPKLNPHVLHIKVWNAEYDNNRFRNGIFNLSRLAISDRKINLNDKESQTIQLLIESALDLKESKGIVLDGLFCQLEINDKTLRWNTNTEMNDNLNKLVVFLRGKIG